MIDPLPLACGEDDPDVVASPVFWNWLRAERQVIPISKQLPFTQYVVAKRRVLDDVRKHLGMTERELLDRLFSYLRNGGRLAKVEETRDLDFVEFRWEFHHDMWPELGSRTIYVETRFRDAEKLEDRMIYIVSVHPPNSVNWN